MAESGELVRGIDVSGHQGQIDWPAVAAAGVAFAIAKATEGDDFSDRRFAFNWAEARRAGLIRGAYHYFRPDDGAAAQADHYVRTVGGLEPGDLPPALDVEVAHGASAAEIMQGMAVWLERVEAALGRRPIVYTYPSFWQNTLGNPQRFNDYPLWLAHYTNAPRPTVPGAWKRYTIWQHSDEGAVGGISTPVDLNRFAGSLDELKALADSPPLEGVFRRQWRSIRADVALNEGAAIYRSWLARRRAQDLTLGVPLSDEMPDPQRPAGTVQIFSGGIASWHPGEGVRWR